MTKEAALTCAVWVCGTLVGGSAAAQSDPALWITDDATKNIYRVGLDGAPLRAPLRPPVGATSGLAIDAGNGTFWAAREGLDATAGLVNFSRSGNELAVIPRTAFNARSALEGVATDPNNAGVLWVVDDPLDNQVTSVVYRIATDGTLLSSFERPLPANSPQAIAVDPFDGTLWITDNRQDRIYNVSTDGVDLSSFPSSSYDPNATNPQGITVDAEDGTLWITDRTTQRVYNVSGAGVLIDTFPTSAYEAASNASPVGITFEVDGAAPRTETVRDEFNAVSFGNNDGTVPWAADWVEFDPDGTFAGSGQVAIFGNMLTLEDRPNSGTEPSIQRRADLGGAASAEFSFDFATTPAVDPGDAVTVDISDDGGNSWTVLEVFTNIFGASSGSRSYDVSGFATSATDVRFRVTNLYGGNGEFFLVDNVQIAFDTGGGPGNGLVGTARDNFESVSFSNSDGDLAWAVSWAEDDPFGGSNNPVTGQVAVENGSVNLEDRPNSGTQPGLSRGVDLSGAQSATLTFDFATSAGVDPGDAVVVDVSSNDGASYATLDTFAGIVGASSGTRCYDVSGFATAGTRIRFRVTNRYGGRDEFFFVDNVAVAAGGPGC